MTTGVQILRYFVFFCISQGIPTPALVHIWNKTPNYPGLELAQGACLLWPPEIGSWDLVLVLNQGAFTCEMNALTTAASSWRLKSNSNHSIHHICFMRLKGIWTIQIWHVSESYLRLKDLTVDVDLSFTPERPVAGCLTEAFVLKREKEKINLTWPRLEKPYSTQWSHQPVWLQQ